MQHALGLVVGKFSPLHLGHEWLIARAAEACRRVLVLGYSHPELPGCGRARREAWVARRCPQVINCQVDDAWLRRRCAERGLQPRPMPRNDAPDDVHQAWLAWLLEGPVGLRPDAMFASEAYVFATCELLARRWQRTVAPVLVDAARSAVPVSATLLRGDLQAHRRWLHPDVYDDYLRALR